MGQRIKIRRDTSVNWASINPILQEGEQGYDTTAQVAKIGDGITAWNNLPYQKGGEFVFIVPCSNTALSITQNHGLNANPTSIQLFLRCDVSTNGYTVGDVVTPINTSVISISKNSTTATLSKAATGSILNIIPKAGGAAVSALASQWSFVVKVYR